MSLYLKIKRSKYWKLVFNSPARLFGSFTILATTIGVLQAFGVWERILASVNLLVGTTVSFLGSNYFGVPRIYWLIISTLFFGICYFLAKQGQYLKLVAGEFYDDFDHGLDRWNYGKDLWKTELDDGESALSVTESDAGGITQVGFWDRFSFSFESKLLAQGKGGWVVKAWDRSNYIMLQVVLLDKDGSDTNIALHKGVYIRPHYRYRGKWIVLPHYKISMSKSASELIRPYSWFRVEVKVRGNTIDLYLENEHVYHMVLDDPLVVESFENFKVLDDDQANQAKLKTKRLDLFSYPSGKVGFRCSGTGEHMHIRRVRVRPILS